MHRSDLKDRTDRTSSSTLLRFAKGWANSRFFRIQGAWTRSSPIYGGERRRRLLSRRGRLPSQCHRSQNRSRRHCDSACEEGPRKPSAESRQESSVHNVTGAHHLAPALRFARAFAQSLSRASLSSDWGASEAATWLFSRRSARRRDCAEISQKSLHQLPSWWIEANRILPARLALISVRIRNVRVLNGWYRLAAAMARFIRKPALTRK